MQKEKVLFVYNGRIEVDEAGRYFGNELNDHLVNRYKYLGKSVTFLVRKREVSVAATKSLQAFTSSNFSVITVSEFNSPLKFFKHKVEISKIINKAVYECDILVARLPSTLGGMAINFARSINKPYLIEVVGCPWDALWNHSLIGKIFAPIAFVRMRLLVKNAPFVIYVTSNFLQKRYPNHFKSIAISDVILINPFKPDFDERFKRFSSFKKNDTELILGTVAAVNVRYKGHILVFESLRLLKEKGINVKYLVIGKGDQLYLKSKAKKFDIEDMVLFIGEVPHNVIFHWLKKIDIYIQPSKQEGLPRALVEAMSVGCVCIGTAVGGIPELLNKLFIINKYNAKNIVSIIHNLSIEEYKKFSLENYEKSKFYAFEYLEKKRQVFYELFLESI